MANSTRDNGSFSTGFRRLGNRPDFLSRNKWNKAVDYLPPILKEPAGFWEMYCDTEETDSEDFFSRNTWNKAVDSLPPILKEPAGFWEMYCDTEETDSEGFTEFDRMWAAVKELVAEKIFIQASYKEHGMYTSNVAIKCFIEDYSDIEKVMQSAAELRRIHFPAVFYMKTNYFDEIGKSQLITRYLHCSDGDLYECNYVNFRGYRLLKSNSSTNK